MAMRFFVDSAEPDAWDGLAREGWLHGATTNPLLLEKAGLACTHETAEHLVSRAEATGLAELQVQAWGGTTDAYVTCGIQLADLWDKLTVKLPATAAGFAAARILRGEGIPITLTACHTLRQFAAALALGLDYAAPYSGRRKEAGQDADRLLATMLDMRKAAERAGTTPTRVLVASVRDVDQAEALLAAGHDTLTLPTAVATHLARDERSEAAAHDFEAAAGRTATRNGETG